MHGRCQGAAAGLQGFLFSDDTRVRSVPAAHARVLLPLLLLAPQGPIHAAQRRTLAAQRADGWANSLLAPVGTAPQGFTKHFRRWWRLWDCSAMVKPMASPRSAPPPHCSCALSSGDRRWKASPTTDRFWVADFRDPSVDPDTMEQECNSTHVRFTCVRNFLGSVQAVDADNCGMEAYVEQYAEFLKHVERDAPSQLVDIEEIEDTSPDRSGGRRLAWLGSLPRNGVVGELNGLQEHEVPWHLDRIDQRYLPLDNMFTYGNTASRTNLYGEHPLSFVIGAMFLPCPLH